MLSFLTWSRSRRMSRHFEEKGRLTAAANIASKLRALGASIARELRHARASVRSFRGLSHARHCHRHPQYFDTRWSTYDARSSRFFVPPILVTSCSTVPSAPLLLVFRLSVIFSFSTVRESGSGFFRLLCFAFCQNRF